MNKVVAIRRKRTVKIVQANGRGVVITTREVVMKMRPSRKPLP